jgi:nucleoside-diphosphate-sugar epimerase
MEKQLHVIYGTGPLGRSVMTEVLKRGHKVRMVNRTGKSDVPEGVELVRADAFTGLNIHSSAVGAAVVYQCTNPPYDRWPELFPAMQKNIMMAAAKNGAKLIIGENIYMYGDNNGRPYTEDLPNNAQTRKGKTRAAMADEALQAHRDGTVRVAIGRASDYFGPYVLASAMGERAFLPALRGRAASLLGNIDLPHTFSFIKDVGRGLATLADHDDALGQIWHTPNSEPISQREFMLRVFAEIDTTPKMQAAGKTMMQFAGLFVPAVKEIVEMMYEFDKPFIVDSSKFENRFGDVATPLDTAIRETVDWYRDYVRPQVR